MPSNEMWPLSEEIKQLEGAVSICMVQKYTRTATMLLYANSESSCFLSRSQTLLIPRLRFSGGLGHRISQ